MFANWVPLVLCCPFFFIAGKAMVKKQAKARAAGEKKELQDTVTANFIKSFFGGDQGMDANTYANYSKEIWIKIEYEIEERRGT